MIGDDSWRVSESTWGEEEGSTCTEDWGEEGWCQRLWSHATAFKQEG